MRPASGYDLEFIRANLYSAVLSDCLDAVGLRNQCLASGLQPLFPDQVMAGHAFPVAIERVSEAPEHPFRGLVAALDAIGPGEVFVTATGRAHDIAVWGELLSTAASRRGAAGAVTDGLIRDSRGIKRLGFPVWSAGTIPYDSLGRHEVVAHRVPVVIDGVAIEPGDLIVADNDGVVVVPQAIADDIVAAAVRKRASERQFKAAVSQGMGAAEAFAKFGVL
ncbi:MAG: RraA family protein [Propionibacteriaceae bacterium]|nr:RraA family protein [Propionibacteriaceae bacterium]